MKRRISKLLVIVMIVTSAVFMSACATDDTIPISKDDDKEEYDKVTTYAAELLMKYSYNIVDDLTYVAIKNSEKGENYKETETVTVAQTNAFEGMAIDSADEEQEESSEGLESEDVETTTNDTDDEDNESAVLDGSEEDMENTEENDSKSSDNVTKNDADNDNDASFDSSTADADNSTKNDDSASQTQTENETIVANDNLSDLDPELGGLKLAFNGYSVMNAYPSMNAQGAVTAGSNEKVLVLNFVLSNPTSSGITLNILNRNATFKVSVNGSNVGYTKVTMLTNDLSSYVGTVSAGAEEQLVLLVVIPSSQASSISDVAVTVNINSNTYTIKLE